MGWPQTRSIIIAICVAATLLLFGVGKTIGLDITKDIGAGFSWLPIIGIGTAYIGYMVWRAYI